MKKAIVLKAALLVILSICNYACIDRVTIPETDTTPPSFSFKIEGDGFSRTFTQDDDFSRMQLNLRANKVYSFVFTGDDAGGMALLQWQLGENETIEFDDDFPGGEWTIRDISSTNRMIEWQGDGVNPIRGMILTGDFVARNSGPNTTVSTSFRFFVRDFGGRSGTANQVSGELYITIGDFTTELKVIP
ncbi:hypothetical protein M0G43_08180 [Subsaxibacter sp. CAU 1640]|uniref:hypothetical protein n=1 Tax=Subsaxibacter sp. CAU 1640 TaxID=2933271 RepID=UPI0020061505|nr:hypothetical protein [Subsaxibacter sp. CAU 1640]MCK7590546.1 hypothetical protein [Subsaxibacter sp. CAU 1640]